MISFEYAIVLPTYVAYGGGGLDHFEAQLLALASIQLTAVRYLSAGRELDKHRTWLYTNRWDVR